MEKSFTKKSVFTMTFTSMMGVLGFVLMMYNFRITLLMPSFIKFDFSEVATLVTAFLLGPLPGVGVCLIKNLLNLIFMSDTGGVGEVANFLIGSTLSLIAGGIYHRKKSLKWAIIGCFAGCMGMAIVSVPLNYYVTYPLYLRDTTLDRILSAYQKINSSVDSLMEALLLFNAPFTFAKGAVASIFTVLTHSKLKKIFESFL